MKKCILIFIICPITLLASNYNLKDICTVLKYQESRNKTNIVGDNGKAYGILQIHKIYVEEVNNKYGTKYKHSDMFDEKKSEQVFYLYIRYGIKRFKKLYGVEPTEEDIVRMHNGGLYYGYIRKSTKKYYYKYLKFKKQIIKE